MAVVNSKPTSWFVDWKLMLRILYSVKGDCFVEKDFPRDHNVERECYGLVTLPHGQPHGDDRPLAQATTQHDLPAMTLGDGPNQGQP